MKVYIPVFDYGYDGYGEPLGVFTTPDKAKDAIRKAYPDRNEGLWILEERVIDDDIPDNTY